MPTPEFFYAYTNTGWYISLSTHGIKSVEFDIFYLKMFWLYFHIIHILYLINCCIIFYYMSVSQLINNSLLTLMVYLMIFSGQTFRLFPFFIARNAAINTFDHSLYIRTRISSLNPCKWCYWVKGHIRVCSSSY